MMDPYVAALVIIAALTFMIIMSLYMIEKTMRIENLDFTLDEPLCEELQAEAPETDTTEAEAPETDTTEAEGPETLEAEAPETLEAEGPETLEAEAPETLEAEAPETLEAEAPEVPEVDNSELTLDTGENIVVLTHNEKLIVNKLFSHTIGQLLKIRLENERRRKLE
jgi:hypothetical protein